LCVCFPLEHEDINSKKNSKNNNHPNDKEMIGRNSKGERTQGETEKDVAVSMFPSIEQQLFEVDQQLKKYQSDLKPKLVSE